MTRTHTHQALGWGMALAMGLAAGLGLGALSYLAARETTAMAFEGNKDIPPIDRDAPEQVQTATFALGCFWGPDARFGALPGVVRTRVGYTGGAKKDPTYHDLGDHTEAVQIDFDPQRITYARLLDVFWSAHDPTARAYSRQYRSAVFFHNDDQRALAEETRDKVAASGGRVRTSVQPLGTFYPAEGYHQKYRLRNTRALMREFARMFPDEASFVASTAAARVNGYLAGYATSERVAEDLDRLGLAGEPGRALLEHVREHGGPTGCPAP